MKRLLALFLLPALPALALPTRFLYETQALTRAAPTLASEGMSLLDATGAPVRGYFVAVCAAVGQTLSGGGALRAWVYDVDEGVWMRNPDQDLVIGTTVAGQRCRAWDDKRTGYLLGRRVHYAADGVTVSGGTTVTVRISGDTEL